MQIVAGRVGSRDRPRPHRDTGPGVHRGRTPGADGALRGGPGDVHADLQSAGAAARAQHRLRHQPRDQLARGLDHDPRAGGRAARGRDALGGGRPDAADPPLALRLRRGGSAVRPGAELAGAAGAAARRRGAAGGAAGGGDGVPPRGAAGGDPRPCRRALHRRHRARRDGGAAAAGRRRRRPRVAVGALLGGAAGARLRGGGPGAAAPVATLPPGRPRAAVAGADDSGCAVRPRPARPVCPRRLRRGRVHGGLHRARLPAHE